MTSSQNMLDEVNDSAVVVDDVKQLAGMTSAQIATAADEAKTRGLAGKYVLTLLNTTGQPLESQLTYRPLRQRLHAASIARGSHGGRFDNTALVSRIVKIRAERAALLGFPNHAAYKLEDQTARTPDAVNAMLRQLAPPAVAQCEARSGRTAEGHRPRRRRLPARALGLGVLQRESARREIRLRRIAAEALPRVVGTWKRTACFYAANQLYGLTFKRRTDLPVYQPDVRVYDVFDADGKPLAIYIADRYARKSKNGGAWMNEYVSQSALMGTRPVVANH